MKEIEEDEYKGWIRLYRKSLKNGWLQNHKFWAFWCYCLLRANHKETKVTIGYQHVNLKPGQFIFGRKKAASELKLSEQEVRTCLKNLEKYKNITINTTNKFSVITINKWEEYQPPKNEGNQQNSQQLTINQPTSNQQVTTDKNDKNVKNGEEEENITAQAREVLEYLNEIKGARFRKIEDIIPRLREGYTVEDCKKVIFQKSKDQYFIDHPKYLCPETLFRPSHFEKYLNENGTKINETMAPQQKQTINPGLTDVNAINDKILYEKMPGNLMPGDRERIAREHPDWVMGEI